MYPDEINKLVKKHIVDNWASTPIAHPNKKFKPAEHAPDGRWIRYVVKGGESRVGELGTVSGGGIGLRTGVLLVSVFVPENDGNNRANRYARDLETLFRRVELGNSCLIFDEPQTEELTEDENGFYHVMVRINYHAFIGE